MQLVSCIGQEAAGSLHVEKEVPHVMKPLVYDLLVLSDAMVLDMAHVAGAVLGTTCSLYRFLTKL